MSFSGCASQFHQRIVAFDLMRLATGHLEGERPALGVGAQMDLRLGFISSAVK